jgi:uncharacterized RDD family membrane protein YckC
MTPEQPPPRLATWGSRVGAALLDGLIVWGIALAALTVAAAGGLPGGVWWLLLLIAFCAYYGATMTRKGAHNGQTFGKQTAGVRVVRDDGKPVTLGTVAARDVGLKFVAGNLTFGLGWLVDSLWPLGERENRALHDLAVRTHVVETRPAPRVQQIQPPPWGAPPPQLAQAISGADAARRRIRAATRPTRLERIR